MYGLTITYYHTLYKRLVTEPVAGKVTFPTDAATGKTYAVYASGGHHHQIEIEHIVSIDYTEEV